VVLQRDPAVRPAALEGPEREREREIRLRER
jgi:hypothetical protein